MTSTQNFDLATVAAFARCVRNTNRLSNNEAADLCYRDSFAAENPELLLAAVRWLRLAAVNGEVDLDRAAAYQAAH